MDLTDPILSRFDILCVMKDEVDLNHDSKLVINLLFLFFYYINKYINKIKKKKYISI